MTRTAVAMLQSHLSRNPEPPEFLGSHEPPCAVRKALCWRDLQHLQRSPDASPSTAPPALFWILTNISLVIKLFTRDWRTPFSIGQARSVYGCPGSGICEGMCNGHAGVFITRWRFFSASMRANNSIMHVKTCVFHVQVAVEYVRGLFNAESIQRCSPLSGQLQAPPIPCSSL